MQDYETDCLYLGRFRLVKRHRSACAVDFQLLVVAHCHIDIIMQARVNTTLFAVTCFVALNTTLFAVTCFVALLQLVFSKVNYNEGCTLINKENELLLLNDSLVPSLPHLVGLKISFVWLF